MNEQHPYSHTILPVADGEPRPLWSVMIPTYNCASYLRETLASVLAQDPGPDLMQIAVVDWEVATSIRYAMRTWFCCSITPMQSMLWKSWASIRNKRASLLVGF